MTTSGSIVKAGDTPPVAFDGEGTLDSAFTNTSFATATAAAGQTFIAPTSGAVVILWSARFQTNTTGTTDRALVSVKVSAGGTIDSGTVVSAAADTSALESTRSATQTSGTSGETRMAACTFRVVNGLTAGATYNVVVQRKVTGGNATVFQADVAVLPMA